MQWISRYRWHVLAGLLLIVGAIVTTILLWPDKEEPQRARVYRDYDVCVLTGSRGLADAQASAVWKGAQQVSLLRKVRLLYVPVAGDQTPERAAEFLGSLVQQECEVIVAVGEAPVAAAAANKSKFPHTAIVAVGDDIDESSNDRVTSSTVELLLRLVPAG